MASSISLPRVVQATWVRYHHFDLARELHALGCLERIFTCLPPWIARREDVPREKVSCNFWLQGIRRLLMKAPGYRVAWDGPLACLETATYSRWVEACLPECDAFIGISGSGLRAGRKIQRRGGVYLCDRGSTHFRYAEHAMREEHGRWGVSWQPSPEFLIRNEEAEYAQADAVTVPSNFVRRTFVDEGVPEEKVHVVPYGVNLEEFQPVGGPPEDGTFRIVFVGQVTLRKGVPYLLEAFRQFRHPKKELVIVGAMEESARGVFDKLWTEGVRYVGIVPRAEVERYFSTSHVMTLPSLEEGLALVQAQALACGCPVVATPNTGSENLFTHGVEGFIVPPRDSAALTEAWTKLSDEPDTLAAMRAAALERARRIGGWRAYAEGMLAIASGLLAKRS